MSERRGSNSRHPPWQGGALPAELLSHLLKAVRIYIVITIQSIRFLDTTPISAYRG